MTQTANPIPARRRKYCQNGAGIARDFGTTRQALAQWQQQGCPSYLMPDGSRLYDPADVMDWRLTRITGKNREQRDAEDARRAALRKSGHCPNCAAKLAAR